MASILGLFNVYGMDSVVACGMGSIFSSSMPAVPAVALKRGLASMYSSTLSIFLRNASSSASFNACFSFCLISKSVCIKGCVCLCSGVLLVKLSYWLVCHIIR